MKKKLLEDRLETIKINIEAIENSIVDVNEQLASLDN